MTVRPYIPLSNRPVGFCPLAAKAGLGFQFRLRREKAWETWRASGSPKVSNKAANSGEDATNHPAGAVYELV